MWLITDEALTHIDCKDSWFRANYLPRRIGTCAECGHMRRFGDGVPVCLRFEHMARTVREDDFCSEWAEPGSAARDTALCGPCGGDSRESD